MAFTKGKSAAEDRASSEEAQAATLNTSELALVPVRAATAVTADIVTAIHAEHAEAERALRASVLHGIRAGELLLQAKKVLRHGRWTDWLQQNITFSERLAQAYMRLARLPVEKRNDVADLPLQGALSAIRSKEKQLAEAQQRMAEPRRTAAYRRLGDFTPNQKVIDSTDRCMAVCRIAAQLVKIDVKSARCLLDLILFDDWKKLRELGRLLRRELGEEDDLDEAASLAGRGIDKPLAHKARTLAKMPREAFEQHVDAKREAARRRTKKTRTKKEKTSVIEQVGLLIDAALMSIQDCEGRCALFAALRALIDEHEREALLEFDVTAECAPRNEQGASPGYRFENAEGAVWENETPPVADGTRQAAAVGDLDIPDFLRRDQWSGGGPEGAAE